MGNGYEAVIVVSFGGPEGPEEVMPFLENVLRGKNIPRERMLEVAEHYQHFGGKSPINAQNRALISALEGELTQHGLSLPVYWGNRNWHPFLAETVGQMMRDGVKRALALVTSAYSSYSGCRQYLEDIGHARDTVGPQAPQIDKLRVFYNHPGFVAANADSVRSALQQIPGDRRERAPLVFTAHSIPLTMARNCSYETQLRETAGLVAQAAGRGEWQLVFQSRSGPPSQPWLAPDICDYLRELKRGGASDVVVSPIGFISDHLEVLYDLDTEAQQVCSEIGLNMVRAATAGTHPRFIQMLRQLIVERMSSSPVRHFLGKYGPSHDVCPQDCCLTGKEEA